MRSIYIATFLFFIASGCQDDMKIVTGIGVTSINISIQKKGEVGRERKVICITNPDSIKYIIKKINDCNQEPVKFYPAYTLLINYQDSVSKNITCNGKAMMDNEGHTYMLKQDIGDILGF